MTIRTTTAPMSDMPPRRSQEQAWNSAARDYRSGDLAPGANAPEPLQSASLARAALEARSALAAAVDAATLAVQRAQSVSTALDEALIVLTDADVAPPTEPIPTAAPASSGPALSSREREVLALVAEGRTNKAIAAALYVSPNTVKTHIASLLNKLQAETRVQLAVIASRQTMMVETRR